MIYASAKLKHAFYTYCNIEPLEMRAQLIVSKPRARELGNPNHPLNIVLPDREIIITGDTHSDAVASKSPTNSRIMQKMLDGEGPVQTGDSTERPAA